MRRDCILPGVKLIDYIEASGTQYIDTGIRLNGNSRVVCDYMVTQYQTALANSLAPFGARAGWKNLDYNVLSPANRISGFFTQYGNQSKTTEIYNLRNSLIHIDFNRNEYAWSVGNNNYSKTFTLSTFQTQGNCYLFKCNYHNELAQTNGIDTGENGHVRMMLFDIYDDAGVHVRQFRPGLLEGRPGLLDLCGSICPATGTPFYVNSGTGEFLYA